MSHSNYLKEGNREDSNLQTDLQANLQAVRLDDQNVGSVVTITLLPFFEG